MFYLEQTVKFKSCKMCKPDHSHCLSKRCLIKEYLQKDGYVHGVIKLIRQGRIDIQLKTTRDLSSMKYWEQKRYIDSISLTLAPGVLAPLTEPQSKKIKFRHLAKTELI